MDVFFLKIKFEQALPNGALKAQIVKVFLPFFFIVKASVTYYCTTN
jgi:hypothetical protein